MDAIRRWSGSPRAHALGTALSVGGWALGLSMWFIQTGGRFPTGIDLGAYLRGAHDFLAGNAVYVGHIGDATNFPYAPTWAVLFATLAWIPGPMLQAALTALDLAALRYVTGSWRATGWVLWCPLVMFEIVSGNIDLLIAAAMVMAWRGRSWPLALVGLAKIAPLLALPVREWRRAALVIAGCILVTLPWLHLWPEWFAYLLRQPALIPISLPIPWFVRLPFALALVATRRSWVVALGAVIAMPSMYLSTLLILLAPARLYLDRPSGTRAQTLDPEKGHAVPGIRTHRQPSVIGPVA